MIIMNIAWLRHASKVIALSLVEAEQYKCIGVSEEKIARA